METRHADEVSSSGSSSGESSGSTVELNVKTLDSQIYSFQVDKNMSVSLFKEKIANKTRMPVDQQRLIFRGRVLSDDHPLSEYHVENGHTLHLVEKQQSQSQSGTTSGETTWNDGNDAPSRNRIGQISHSVLLGSLNIGEQGEGAVPDLSRVLGAVLNSAGIGSQGTMIGTSGLQFLPSTNAPGQFPHGTEISGGQTQAGSQAQSGPVFSSQPFQSSPQVVQIPLSATAIPVSIPTRQTPIPHSLNTLSEFMSRMEQALVQNGYQPNSSPTNLGELPRVQLPSNAQGMPSIEALSMILRHAQQLLSSRATDALSHIAGRLEQEGSSSDSTTRGQIQTEAMQIGLAMQHLGALLLELGRTIMTLSMGPSPGESVVNAGPAVYISPAGPNPIMVQPFPLHTSLSSGGSVPPPNFVSFAPVGVGVPPRHLNIHLHAGTSLMPMVSTVGSRTSSGEGVQAERGNFSSSGDPNSAHMLPVRNVTATAVPSGPTGVAISRAVQGGLAVSVTESPTQSVPLSSVISDINVQMRNLLGNRQGGNQEQSGEGDATVRIPAAGSSADAGSEQKKHMAGYGVPEPSTSSPGFFHDREDPKATNTEDRNASNSNVVVRYSSGRSFGDSSGERSEDASSNALKPSDTHERVPLGLGMGGLERKRSSRQLKGGNGGASGARVNARTSGQHLFQTLVSHQSSMNSAETHNPQHMPFNVEQDVQNTISGMQGSNSPIDMANAMSQILQSPALNGFLGGVSEQSRVGSSDSMRIMLQQLTQNPAMMNTVSQIAQQVDDRELENMFAGAGRGQRGGMDLSRMIQQMMPVVSQALSGGPNPAWQPSAQVPGHQQQDERRMTAEDALGDKNINLQQVRQRIEQLNTPEDVFRSMVVNAVQLYGHERVPEDLIDELCSNEGLTRAYMEMLCGDFSRQFPGDFDEEYA